ncbi:glycosyltransferase [Staphylococcus felis]|uniref:glycosyltransferase n=1 Tax=Staphylococcus felis TaxID=46127 RepID=UPI000E239DCC|nr:glycosyltransferase [Staphylococcus felis]REH78027.1 glycosyl transferase [Staphylococcus felis]REI35078.1 glycosyl transferase [Staphylococcus felis]UXR86136.1 glycosyltransferase [Staphylococcus felis]
MAKETQGQNECLLEAIELIKEDYNLGLEKLTLLRNTNDVASFLRDVREKGKLDFLAKHENELKIGKSSNGSRILKKSKYSIGMIADEFLYNSFKDIANIKYISKNAKLERMDFDFVIVATTWKGIDDSWKGLASPNSHLRVHLEDMLSELRERKIPLIFYSKEDPVNYHLFKDIATQCDYIYTTAKEVIEDYKNYTNNEHVNVLQFGINPHYHNPIGTRSPHSLQNNDEVIFAGSWTKKYPERNKDMGRIFDGIIETKKELTIFDRNLELERERYLFPNKYIPYITKPVDHHILMDIHKIFRWAVNVNSVKYSETMFANRVFELQAFGNLLISNYSAGVNNQFPNIFMVNSKEDVISLLNQYSEFELREFQSKNIRNVMLSNTTYHRLDEIVEKIGLQKNVATPNVGVVVSKETSRLVNMFERQMNVDKTLITEQELENRIYEFDFITFFEEKHEYEEYYLADLLSAFYYTDVDFVTKNLDLSGVHEYTEDYTDKSLTMFDAKAYLKSAVNKGYTLDDAEVFSTNKQLCSQNDYVSVIIPIHNNGRYLEDKCMRSLRKSSIFEHMEVIFVDDGSTDEETLKVINRLRRKYPNIVYFKYESGSGSASRPRNKGAELASTKYITYLDPDNEAIGDGYAKLYKKLNENSSIDMVVGNIIKEDNKRRAEFKYFSTIKKYNNGSELITNTKKFLKASGLRAQSIQALMVKSDIIKKNQIQMVEGAAGQDTVYFQELMLFSNKVLGFNEPIHTYYAAVTGSVTNSISKRLFDKYYKLEIERIPFLKKHGLLDDYMERRFNFYIKGWYLPRLEKVKVEEREQAIKRFLDIYDLYDSFSRPKDIELEDYIQNYRSEVKS